MGTRRTPSGIFFLGWLLRFAANRREPYDRGGRIWSLEKRCHLISLFAANRTFRNKPAVSASKLRQTAHLIISLQQIAANRILYNKFIANRTFYNKFIAKYTNCTNCINYTNCTNRINYINCINYNYISLQVAIIYF